MKTRLSSVVVLLSICLTLGLPSAHRGTALAEQELTSKKGTVYLCAVVSGKFCVRCDGTKIPIKGGELSPTGKTCLVPEKKGKDLLVGKETKGASEGPRDGDEK